jgi:hypothetical protein
MNRYILSGLMAVEKVVPLSSVHDQESALAELRRHIAMIKQRAIDILNETIHIQE